MSFENHKEVDKGIEGGEWNWLRGLANWEALWNLNYEYKAFLATGSLSMALHLPTLTKASNQPSIQSPTHSIHKHDHFNSVYFFLFEFILIHKKQVNSKIWRKRNAKILKLTQLPRAHAAECSECWSLCLMKEKQQQQIFCGAVVVVVARSSFSCSSDVIVMRCFLFISCVGATYYFPLPLMQCSHSLTLSPSLFVLPIP